MGCGGKYGSFRDFSLNSTVIVVSMMGKERLGGLADRGEAQGRSLCVWGDPHK